MGLCWGESTTNDRAFGCDVTLLDYIRWGLVFLQASLAIAVWVLRTVLSKVLNIFRSRSAGRLYYKRLQCTLYRHVCCFAILVLSSNHKCSNFFFNFFFEFHFHSICICSNWTVMSVIIGSLSWLIRGGGARQTTKNFYSCWQL